jgi:hypothetical protein
MRPDARTPPAALGASSAPPDELVVVDGRPAPGRGKCNSGAADASAEVIAFVDADVEVHEDALERFRRAFAADPRLVAVFGSYDDEPADPAPVSRFRNLLHHHVHSSSPGPAETFWAGLGAIRRDAFLAAGGFDAARYPEPAIEDIELGTRLVADGASIVLDPQIRGTHLKRWSLTSMVRTDLVRRGIPWVQLQLESGRVRRAQLAGATGSARSPRWPRCWRQRAGGRARPRAGGLVALNARFCAASSPGRHRAGGVDCRCTCCITWSRDRRRRGRRRAPDAPARRGGARERGRPAAAARLSAAAGCRDGATCRRSPATPESSWSRSPTPGRPARAIARSRAAPRRLARHIRGCPGAGRPARPDAIIVASPPGDHLEYARLASKAGIPCLVE